MKKLIFFTLITLTAALSCRSDRDGYGITQAATNEVEISITKEATTRAAIPEENIIDELDLLVFDGDGKFMYWRSARKVGTRFRATLAVSSNLDVYFIANRRNFLMTEIWPTDQSLEDDKGKTKAQIREKLVESGVARIEALCINSGNQLSYVPLPMWGMLSSMEVRDITLNQWGTVEMIRSVASVDVNINPAVDNFELQDMYLFFVPDQGYLIPSESNRFFEYGMLMGVKEPEAPASMQTTVRLYSDLYDQTQIGIVNKFYLYDNNTREDAILTDTKRHTRIVIGGQYTFEDGLGNPVSAKYYYPIDFIDDDDQLMRITRNWKYLFMVNSVTAKGYNDPETASKEPPVGLNVSVIDWNLGNGGEFIVNGDEKVYISKRNALLARYSGSYDEIAMTSNKISANDLKMEFENAANGTGVPIPETGELTGATGLSNDRFLITKLRNGQGDLTGLQISARGDFDTSNPSANSDVLIVTTYRQRFRIEITQVDLSPDDWEDGGNEDIGIGNPT